MEMNKYIDRTLLKADATYDKIETLYAEAREYDFAGICVNSCWVSACTELLKGTDIKVCIMVGFPLEAMSIKARAFEAVATIADGVKEIDMALNIGEMKAGHYDAVRADVKVVVEVIEGNYIEVTLENCLLAKEEIVKACGLCMEAGAAFVRTSTGLSTGGATPEDVKLTKDTVKECCLVKTAGGVRYYEDMEKMMEAGADHIGTSVGAKLMQRETSDGGY